MASRRKRCGHPDHRSGDKKPRILPYGATRGRYWCWGCDAEVVPSWTKPIKKTERQRAKKAIKSGDE